MPKVLKGNDQGPDVTLLQNLLVQRGYAVAVDGAFGPPTFRAVRAFQSQNLDAHGQPLVVDGAVGPITWWSLTHPKPAIQTPAAVDFHQAPPEEAGGGAAGRIALAAASGELTAGAGEEGGNNSGPWVRKYLNDAAPEGSSWCTAFVSWCYARNAAGIPFPYTVGARALLREFKARGWAKEPASGYAPRPGDVVVWWRVQLAGWLGHAGLVYELRDGMLYTIEGNRSPRVQGFSYVFSRMDKLLGFGHVPA